VAGVIHRGSDFPHLAAAAWWGALPLALIRPYAGAPSDRRRLRNGNVQIFNARPGGVEPLPPVVNTWALVGDGRAFIETQYGRLLLVKVALFAVMVGIAAVNRLKLGPILPNTHAFRSLGRNALVEFALGLIIVAIVGALGVLPPAVHEGMHLHSH
jgi:putative copper resistance protein D